MNTTLTTTMTNEDIAAMALGVLGVGIIVFYVLLVIASWKILTKAGEKGWKSLIPFYNIYVLMKIVNMKGYFWLEMALMVISAVAQAIGNYYPDFSTGIINWDFANHPVVAVIAAVCFILEIVVGVTFAIRLAKAFGHGTGYAIGLVLLPNIFLLIIGFGSSKYDKKALKD